MKANQVVLFAGAVEGETLELSRRLRAIDLEVRVAADFDAADHAVTESADLALVIIRGEPGVPGAATLLGTIKDRNRNVPVMWIGPSPRLAVSADVTVPSDATAAVLEDKARALLINDLYPPSVVRAFVSTCNTVLTATFESAVEASEPALSRSSVRPGNVSGFMLISDDETSAHLIVSAYEADLAALAERIGFDPAEGQRRLAIDLASELVNQIVGRLKTTVDLLSNLRLALPYVFTGEHVGIYSPTPKPSLSLALSSGDVKLVVDFWMKTRRAVNVEEEARLQSLGDDGLLLF